MKKTLAILLLTLLMLTGCEFFTGKRVTTTDPKTGEVTVTYEDAPIEAWTGALALAVPTLGAGAVALGRLARNAMRTRDGLMDANKDAIENADWSQINSAESFKELLNLYQSSHDDSKLLAGEFKKWKKKQVFKS